MVATAGGVNSPVPGADRCVESCEGESESWLTQHTLTHLTAWSHRNVFNIDSCTVKLRENPISIAFFSSWVHLSPDAYLFFLFFWVILFHSFLRDSTHMCGKHMESAEDVIVTSVWNASQPFLHIFLSESCIWNLSEKYCLGCVGHSLLVGRIRLRRIMGEWITSTTLVTAQSILHTA